MKDSTVSQIACSGLLFTFVVIVLLGAGWIMNGIKFVQLDFKAPVKAEIIRGIGLFPPFGAVIGWIPIKDGE
jgi:hypothetical protein